MYCECYTWDEMRREDKEKWVLRLGGAKVKEWWDQDTLVMELLQKGPAKCRYMPQWGDEVKFTYVIKTLDGRGIEWSRKPLRIRIGDCVCPEHALILTPGFLEGITRMTRGTRAKLYIPSRLGVGWGADNELARNADLVVEVTLIRIFKGVGGIYTTLTTTL